jgi:phytoene synthase
MPGELTFMPIRQPAAISRGYFGETQSALFQMAAIVAGGEGVETAELSGHAGVAYGLTRRLAAFAADRGRGRTVLPADLLAGEG